MNIRKLFSRHLSLFSVAVALVLGVAATGCEDSKSYAEKLTDENHAVNLFLADHKVIDHVPADSVFETGEDAPYYCLDTENSIYMQVINPGDGEKPAVGQTVYFRYLRYALSTYSADNILDSENWSGNANSMTDAPAYFKFDNYQDYASSTWGTGIQLPLHFLRLNCDVNLVIKSQYGPTSEISYVTPFLFRVRYFKSQI